MACKKTCFPTKEDALRAVRRAQANPRNDYGYVPTDAYFCRGCKRWHVTSTGAKAQNNPRYRRRK